jgi:hypothetical protein
VFKWATESAILMAMVSQQGAGFRLSDRALEAGRRIVD